MNTRKILSVLTTTIIFTVLMGVISVSAQETRPEEWSEETHSNSADPNYDMVFPQDAVNTINITISPENWQMIMDDMTEHYGEFGPIGDWFAEVVQPRAEQQTWYRSA